MEFDKNKHDLIEWNVFNVPFSTSFKIYHSIAIGDEEQFSHTNLVVFRVSSGVEVGDNVASHHSDSDRIALPNAEHKRQSKHNTVGGAHTFKVTNSKSISLDFVVVVV